MITGYSLAQECSIFDKPYYNIQFENILVEYEFEIESFNKSVIMPVGMNLDSKCGLLFFFVPVEPIEIATNTSIVRNSEIDTTFVSFFGYFAQRNSFIPLNDFPYIETEGTYGSTIRGSFGSENTKYIIESFVFIKNRDEKLFLDISIPFDPIKFGIDTTTSAPILKREFSVKLKGSVDLDF